MMREGAWLMSLTPKQVCLQSDGVTLSPASSLLSLRPQSPQHPLSSLPHCPAGSRPGDLVGCGSQPREDVSAGAFFSPYSSSCARRSFSSAPGARWLCSGPATHELCELRQITHSAPWHPHLQYGNNNGNMLIKLSLLFRLE